MKQASKEESNQVAKSVSKKICYIWIFKISLGIDGRHFGLIVDATTDLRKSKSILSSKLWF